MTANGLSTVARDLPEEGYRLSVNHQAQIVEIWKGDKQVAAVPRSDPRTLIEIVEEWEARRP